MYDDYDDEELLVPRIHPDGAFFRWMSRVLKPETLIEVQHDFNAYRRVRAAFKEQSARETAGDWTGVLHPITQRTIPSENLDMKGETHVL
jgi:hypothetical protein